MAQISAFLTITYTEATLQQEIFQAFWDRSTAMSEIYMLWNVFCG